MRRHGDVAPLYNPAQEKDACGVGFIAATDPSRTKDVLGMALSALARLGHRGGVAADGLSGDGAGVLTRIPQQLFAEELPGRLKRSSGPLAVGCFFLPREKADAARARELIGQRLSAAGIPLLAWRDVPVDPSALGSWAQATMPTIAHAILGRPRELDEEAFERNLYIARKAIEKAALSAGLDEVYVVSLSSRTIVYKGLLTATQLGRFYRDLADPLFTTDFAVFHQRYSTNTMPTWRRAQPFRMLAHNGEINTLQGNVNWMRAREADLSSPYFAKEEITPVIDESGSDSAMLDNALELLTMAGRDPLHAAMMLVPEVWEGIESLAPDLKAFYHFHACLMEPWDGPAALVFSDGRYVAAALDRNGLRPMRYTLTTDGLVIAGSETGIVEITEDRVLCHGRLGPGEMLAVDTRTGEVLDNAAIKRAVSSRRPYAEWLEGRLVSLSASIECAGAGQAPGSSPGASGLEASGEPELPSEDELVRAQAAFGYTSEEMTVILRPMVEDGKEPDGSMGDDTPPAVLSRFARPLFHYFKERFAEVTNPPIDHLRERVVFSLRTQVGPRGNILAEGPEQADLIELDSPILLDHELTALEALAVQKGFRPERIEALFAVEEGPDGLLPALRHLCRRAEEAVDRGSALLIITDKGVDPSRAPIPSMMAVGAVHHHLIRTGKRMRASLIVETGEAREVHHFAALIGYGAQAVNPYLALATARSLAADGRLRGAGVTPGTAEQRFRRAVCEGLLKVMSKMGIATVESYQGAQVFEAVGIAREVIDTCFAGTPSAVGGSGFRDIARIALSWHRDAFSQNPVRLNMFGFYKPRKAGEHHDFTPESARLLQKAVILGASDDPAEREQGYEEYRRFVALVRSYPAQIREYFEFLSDRQPIPLSQVEPEEAIIRRFSTAQMSLGALSPEAHETLAIAMNRLGARSGSGEGGEDEARYGTLANSAVKQVASGRFGVTPAYLASATELQIKMAQGSKPGEGGQIPGYKVTSLIAKLRHTSPGITLISPPPHHDIYSIEDLAQLIYDLKQANPKALVSVKLVAQTGVGIIAAGVAKGYADAILISGGSGGTGSSPLNSIKNAGLPWEIGLAETQQALLANGLRERVALRADGGFKSAHDVLVAAMLGADEYSFGTVAMMAEGCIMARVCHTNNCPVGVATQDPKLRAKFPGRPEMVMAYFRFVAREVRELLAQLGYATLDQVIGRTDLLRPKREAEQFHLDLSALLAVPEAKGERRRTWMSNPLPPEERLDHRLIAKARAAIEEGRPVEIEAEITNAHRTVGATLSYEIATRYGDAGLPDGTIRVRFRGTAGQSFGAFLARGIAFELIGAANDYVGKGLAGGEIVIRPQDGKGTSTGENVLAGNTVLYGATGGALFLAGRAGERFAVRNSGALAVVEGVGHHGCEYMTGGTVVVLGPTGYNFGAGMTGGEAFVLDEDESLGSRINRDAVTAVPLGDDDLWRLKNILALHHRRTQSRKVALLLADWGRAAARFRKIVPKSTKSAGAGEADQHPVEVERAV